MERQEWVSCACLWSNKTFRLALTDYKKYLGLHVECPIFLSDLTKSGVSEQIFVKIPNIKFHESPYRGSGADTCGQEDRRTEGQANRLID